MILQERELERDPRSRESRSPLGVESVKLQCTAKLSRQYQVQKTKYSEVGEED